MPIPLIIAGIAALGGLKITGDILGAIGKKNEADEKAAAARRNAALAERAAIDVEKLGQKAGSKVRSDTSAMIDAQRSQLAARNLNLDYGAPVDLARTSRYYSETDIQTIENNAAKDAWGIRQKESDYLRQSKAYKQEAKNAIIGGVLNVAGDVLQTGLSMGQKGGIPGFGSGTESQTQGVAADSPTFTKAPENWDEVISSWRKKKKNAGGGDFSLPDMSVRYS